MRLAIALVMFLTAASLDAARAATPESTSLTQRGMGYADSGLYPAAVKMFSRAIEADAGNAQAWHERGMVRLEMKQDTLAIADFEQALKLNPRFPGARDWLGRTLANRGDHRRAAEEWLRELRDEPDGPIGMGISPLKWTDCAEQFALAGDRAKAIALLEEYFAKYAARVTSYAIYETSPMRLLAKLYDEVGESAKAAELRKRARGSKHKVPADET